MVESFNEIKMKRYILKTIYLAVLAFIFTSCYDRDIPSVEPKLPAVSNLQYTLIGDSVKLTWSLPEGHGNLTATIQTNTGKATSTATVSGNPTSYTYGLVEVLNEYSFTVKVHDAEGNTSLGQTIRVTRPGAKITKFSVDTIDAKIDNLKREITIYLPAGRDVTKLKPTLEFTSGATVTPASGSTVNFTNPVTYTIVKDGLTFNYTVTAVLAEVPLDYVVVYNGENVAPFWANIAATVNNGVANPLKTGINKTSTCSSIVRNSIVGDDGGRPWSGGAIWGDYKVNLDPAVYNKFTVMVLKESAGTVQLEIQNADGSVKDWLKTEYPAVGQWQELTFDIPAGRTAVINNVLIAPHCQDVIYHTQTIYWDEVRAYKK
ncbi:MAG: hypothetical protein Q8909_18895, partial [Bacteroidota bacterium]|nr:hypothetical protein [Bacteroidota bacterium]